MQEPPGYRPRGYGICIIEEMDWKDKKGENYVDTAVKILIAVTLTRRIQEMFNYAG